MYNNKLKKIWIINSDDTLTINKNLRHNKKKKIP